MKISVIVTFYNQEDFVYKCVESILGQTYKDLQIILVNDGSSDATQELCDAYARQDSRITVIHKENGGVMSARSAGLMIAEGSYVSIVDGDDWIESDMYMKMAEVAVEEDCDFVQCDMFRDRGNISTRPRQVGHAQLIEHPKEKEFIWEALLDQEQTNCYVTPNLANKLIKTLLAKNVCFRLPVSMHHSEDCAAVIDLLANESERIFLLPLSLYHYVWQEKSHNNVSNFSRMLEIIDWYRVAQEIMMRGGIWKQYEKLVQKSVIWELLNTIRSIRAYEGKMPLYCFSDVDILRGKRVVLYGASNIGQDYYYQLRMEEDIQIVAWVDKAANTLMLEGIDLQLPDVLHTLDFDYILVAVKSQGTAEQIIRELSSKVLQEKILWKQPRLMIHPKE